MALAATLSVASVSLLLIFGGRILYEQYYGEQNCEMTYMYLYPQYQVGDQDYWRYRDLCVLLPQCRDMLLIFCH